MRQVNKTNFHDAYLIHTNWQDTETKFTNFWEVNLSYANLSGTNLRPVNLKESKLCEVTFFDGSQSSEKCPKKLPKIVIQGTHICQWSAISHQNIITSEQDIALDKVANNDYLGALEVLEKIILEDPNNIQAYLERAYIYELLEKYPEAIADYSAVINLQPEAALVYNYRANLYSRTKQFSAALKDYNQVILLSPNLSLAYLNRGQFFAQMASYEQARADYELVTAFFRIIRCTSSCLLPPASCLKATISVPH